MNSTAAATEISDRLQEALALHRQGRWESARTAYEAILRREPRHFDALHMLGVMAAQSGDADKGAALIDRAIEIDPRNAAAHVNRGLVLKELGQLLPATASFREAIRLDGNAAEPWYLSGLTLMQLRRHAEALEHFTQALARRAEFAEAHCSRGVALRELRRPEQALASFEQAIALKRDFAEAFSNRGLALEELGQLPEALASHEQAIALNPRLAEAFYNRGVLLKKLRRFAAALASYDQAIALRPDYPEALCNRGNAQKELQQPEAALASYDRAIALRQDFADAHANRANLLRDLRQYEAAAHSYDRALACNAQGKSVRAMRLYTRMHMARWDQLDAERAQLEARIRQGEAAAAPFCILGLSDSAALQRAAAENWVRSECPADSALGPMGGRARHARIRVGYFSADFREHPVAALTAGMFEAHDRTRFEVSAFSYGPDTGDSMRRRLERAFEHFVELRGRSDREIAELARAQEIDVAVDLGGFTADGRPGIFALRAAPVQVSYLGYSGTMGAGFIDYIVADHTLIPAQSRQHYAERIVYLPDTYQVNGSKRQMSDKEFSRAELGLPSAGFVFCCFNNNYKITPATFDGWMRILRRVPDSILWLALDDKTAASNLTREAESRGVPAGRLVFARRVPSSSEHLARYRAADLFLDTLPYNAHTTAGDALWAGLPVLTLAGESFAGRVAASLLHASGLPELVTTTQEQYESTAVELTGHPARLAEFKDRLQRNRSTMPLFDVERFTRHLEDAYMQMYERSLAGAPPEHIQVERQR